VYILIPIITCALWLGSQRTQYVFWRGLCEYFVLAVIKAAINLVINFNAAHARKRENERFDKRAVSPPFVLPSCFTPRHYSFTPQHLLQDILLNPTSNQGTYTHVVSFIHPIRSKQIKINKIGHCLFACFLSIFPIFSCFSPIFLLVSLGFLQKGLHFFYPCIRFAISEAASLPPLLPHVFSSFLP